VTTQPSLTPAAFAAKWHGVTTTEKASAQEHFIDLCRMLGEPTPPTLLGERFAAEAEAASANAFADWLATQQVETLADEYGVSGQTLREVASAVVRSRPNPLIDELDSETLLPREVNVRLLRSVPPASLGRLLANSDPIHLVRDYDSGLNRNSILVAAGHRRLGYLPWDLAVALAPEIDGGREVQAVARQLQDSAHGSELRVGLAWSEQT